MARRTSTESCEFSVASRTSTAIMGGHCGAPDLNCDHVHSVLCTSRMSERMSEDMSGEMSARMSEDMSERMSERMSEDMPEDLSERWSKDMSERLSKEMSERLSKEMSEKTVRRYVRKNVKRYVRKMSERMSEKTVRRFVRKNVKDVSERMSEDMLNLGTYLLQEFLEVVSANECRWSCVSNWRLACMFFTQPVKPPSKRVELFIFHEVRKEPIG